MTWLALLAVTVAVFQVGVMVTVSRRVAEIREWATRWGALAETQLKHEIDIRWVLQLVNPMARRGTAPLPQHLQGVDSVGREPTRSDVQAVLDPGPRRGRLRGGSGDGLEPGPRHSSRRRGPGRLVLRPPEGGGDPSVRVIRPEVG